MPISPANPSKEKSLSLSQIKQLGYNFIRLPYSVQALRSTDVSGIDFSIGSNKELEAKTPLEVMDLIIQECDRQGLLILLDSHRLNDERIPELWYGDGFSEANWINTWIKLAKGFYYISRQNIAPILIGEFGGRLSDTSSPEGIWQNKFVKYIRQKKLSFAYWSWNPNSADTGGILKDDWQSVDMPKQQLLSQLLDVETRRQVLLLRETPREQRGEPAQRAASNFASPPPSLVEEGIRGVNSGASFSSPLSRKASVQLNVTTDIYSNWQTGFCVSFKIKNYGSNKVDNWQLKFKMKQAAINNSWNANFKERNLEYTSTPLDWGRVIEPNQVRDIGFCANKQGDDYQPTQIKVI
jgi:endoglucanase